jgi:CBS domain containing-hemolysin-like protein
VFNTDATISECLDVAEATRYSRFPLCEKGDINRIIGSVHIKDVYALRQKARSGADLIGAARSILYVPECAHLEKLLHRLLDRKVHLAIVVDEYGGTIGMVTLENILEELVGQIQDEFDREKPLLRRLPDNAYELSGALPLHQLAELTGEIIEETDATTTSGMVTSKLGGFPHEGNTMTLGSWILTVEETDGHRVSKLRLHRLLKKEEPPVA